MSYGNRMSADFLRGLSLESEAGSCGDLVALDQDILAEAADEAGELVEVTTEINQAARGAVAMESLISSFVAQKNVTKESLEQYHQSFEALAVAIGMPIDTSALVPSFESNKTTYEYSVEAEDKTEGVLSKIWEWIVTKLKQLKDLIKKLFSRSKVQEEAAAVAVEKTIAEVEIAEVTTSAVKLPAAYAKFLVDASGNPVGLQKAIGAVLTPPVAAFKAIDSIEAAVSSLDLAKINAAVKNAAHPVAVGSKMVVSTGSDKDNPAVGFTVKVESPTPGADLEFPALGKVEVVRGLKRIHDVLKVGMTSKNFSELQKSLDKAIVALQAKAKNDVKGRSKNAVAVRSAVTSFISSVPSAAAGISNLNIKTCMAIKAYAAALKV